MKKIVAMLYFFSISFLVASDIGLVPAFPSIITNECIAQPDTPEPMDIEQEWAKEEYERYRQVSEQLYKLDPDLVISSKLLGGKIPCLFRLLESSKKLEEGKRIIKSAFPQALIGEATHRDCALFY